MKHTYEEKKIIQTTIKPSEVYLHYVGDIVREIINRDPPKAFQPPKVGDRYIRNDGDIERATIAFHPWEPRFILSKEPVPVEEVWE